MNKKNISTYVKPIYEVNRRPRELRKFVHNSATPEYQQLSKSNAHNVNDGWQKLSFMCSTLARLRPRVSLNLVAFFSFCFFLLWVFSSRFFIFLNSWSAICRVRKRVPVASWFFLYLFFPMLIVVTRYQHLLRCFF